MHLGEKTPGRVQFAIHERGVKNELCSFIGDLRLAPLLHLTTRWLKASLNPVDTHRKRVDLVEAFGMLRQDRREHTRDNVAKPTGNT